MGSVASRPRTPTVTSRTQTSTSTNTAQDTARLQKQIEAKLAKELEEKRLQEEREQRESNLLRRARGRLGTILTGFRGILNDGAAVESANNNTRKTLLGE